jgi:GYF domain 2
MDAQGTTEIWFYVEGDERRGPLALAALLDVLRASPDPRLVLVWRDGMANWERAGAQPEFDPHLPARPRHDSVPPIPAEPPPVAASQPPDDVLAVAMFYRRLILLIGAHVLLTLTRGAAVRVLPHGAELLLGGVWVLCAAALFILVVHTTYKLAEGMRLPAPLAWVLGTMIPFVTLVVLLAISYKARTWCQRHGLEMGLLGPRGVPAT